MLKVPILVSISGALLKGAAIATWSSTAPTSAVHAVVRFDLVSIWFGEAVTELIFDQRRIGPSPNESLTYDILLVAGFAMQCFVVAAFVQWAVRRRPPLFLP